MSAAFGGKSSGRTASPSSGHRTAVRSSPSPKPDSTHFQLVSLYADLFALARGLQKGRHVVASDSGREWVKRRLEEAHNRGRDLGFASSMLDDATFAVIALIDEAMLSSAEPSRQAWRGNTLQHDLFSTTTAGLAFYERLRTAQQKLEENRPLLEIYFTCLSMGFRGRYMLEAPEKREALIAELSAELTRESTVSAAAVSPGWRPPDGFPDAAAMGVPIRITLLVLLGIMILSTIVVVLVAQGLASNIAYEILKLYHDIG